MPPETPASTVEHLQNRIYFLLALLIAGFLLLCGLSVYTLKDSVPPTGMVLYGAFVLMFVYIGFSVYSLFIFLTTTIKRGTPFKWIFVWVHGFGFLLFLTVGFFVGAGILIFKLAFSGLLSNLPSVQL